MAKLTKNKRLERIPKALRGAVEADLSDIAGKIRKKRKSKKLTQEGLAELLEVDPTTIQALESERGRPSLELLLAIVKTLEIKIILK